MKDIILNSFYMEDPGICQICTELFEEKLSLYYAILELEDWLEIKHNPHILTEVYDILLNYYNNLNEKRDEVAYSVFEDTIEETSMVNSEDIDDSEKKRLIDEVFKELDEIWAKEADEKDLYEDILSF